MPRLTLKADPTFTAKVAIPVAGGPAAEVAFTFRHRTKTALAAFFESREGRTDVDLFMDMVVGWDLADEFNRDNVGTLLENRIGTAVATFQAYLEALTAHRAKN